MTADCCGPKSVFLREATITPQAQLMAFSHIWRVLYLENSSREVKILFDDADVVGGHFMYPRLGYCKTPRVQDMKASRSEGLIMKTTPLPRRQYYT
jgi:hypothetical protein